MFVSHKNNILLELADTEWNCRSRSKGMSKPEYWEWIESITKDNKVTYPSENFTILEIYDENVSMRLSELDSYVSDGVYNIKVYASKRNAEEILDQDGESFSPKQYVSSHFVGDDTAKDARILADKWANVRSERNRKLAETDYLALSDNTLSNDMKNYRESLRDIPEDNADPDDISWPAKP